MLSHVLFTCNAARRVWKTTGLWKVVKRCIEAGTILGSFGTVPKKFLRGYVCLCGVYDGREIGSSLVVLEGTRILR